MDRLVSMNMNITEMTNQEQCAIKAQASFQRLDNIVFINKQMKSMMKNTLTNTIFRRAILIVAVFVLANLHVMGQENSFVVKGVVLTGANKPISNVAVSVEGSREMPSITDESGAFEVKAPNGNSWLNISPATSYKKKRVYIDNRSEINVVLTSSDLVSGEDELTIFFQPIKKKNLVSAYTDIDLSDMNKTQSISIDQYMQGRVAGANIVNLSGAPASGASVSLRGVSSINASTQPMYIVDGMPIEPHGVFGSVIDGYFYNPLTAVNPLDVSKLTVFNDPVYTAAYGSKASNGLVVIETLDPSATETSFEVDLRRGLSLSPSNNISQLDSSQHRSLINELIYSSGLNEEALLEKYPSLFLEPTDDDFINYRHNTDWQDIIFGNGSFTNFNIKVKGGDEIASYGLSLGYFMNDGIIKSTDYNGLNLRFVSRVNVYRWLKMNAGVSFNTGTSNLRESAKVKETNPILSALAKSPMLNPYSYDIDKKQTNTIAEVEDLGISNPLAIVESFDANNKNYHFISSIGFDATINKNLSLNSNFGLSYNALKEKVFMPNLGMETYYNQEAYNVAKASTNTLNTFYNNTYLRFNKLISNDHQIVSTTGMNVQTNKFQYDWALTKNAHENDQYQELADGTSSLRKVGGSNKTWNWLSFYENVAYSFRDKYLASASVSFDASSRVGNNAANTIKIGNAPFGLFYSAGLGWRLSNESFMNQASWLDDLKLRVSVGKTGNDDIGETNATNYFNSIRFRETVGLVPATIPNYELTYETTTQLNGGLDIALWGNKLRASADVFSNKVDNMLIYVPLKSYLGYDYRPENAGSMTNTGLEFKLFFRLVDRESFKWDIEANVAKVKNEISDIKGGKQVTAIEGGEIVNMPGAAANSFYGYEFVGVYSTQAEADAAGLVNDKNVKYVAGDAIFKDISGANGTPDGQINNYDKTVIGSSMPDLFGGLTTTFRYKNWSLSAFAQFVSGNEVFNYVRYMNERMSNLDNQSSTTLNRWQYDGQVTNVPRAVWNDLVGNAAFSSRWIEDGSYLRLKNVVLSYAIPHEFLVFKNAEFYVSASNLFTLSKYLGYDPEIGYSYNMMEQGIDYGSTPQSRQFMVGIKFGL